MSNIVTMLVLWEVPQFVGFLRSLDFSMANTTDLLTTYPITWLANVLAQETCYSTTRPYLHGHCSPGIREMLLVDISSHQCWPAHRHKIVQIDNVVSYEGPYQS